MTDTGYDLGAFSLPPGNQTLGGVTQTGPKDAPSEQGSVWIDDPQRPVDPDLARDGLVKVELPGRPGRGPFGIARPPFENNAGERYSTAHRKASRGRLPNIEPRSNPNIASLHRDGSGRETPGQQKHRGTRPDRTPFRIGERSERVLHRRSPTVFEKSHTPTEGVNNECSHRHCTDRANYC